MRNVYNEAVSRVIPPIALNDPTLPIPGFGVAANLFPFPGVWNLDDNNDRNQGGSPAGNGGQASAFVNPISFDGRGRFTVVGDPKTLQLFQITSNPTQFQEYPGFGLAGEVTLLDRDPDPANTFGQDLLSHNSGVTGGNNFVRSEAGTDGVLFTADDVRYLVDDFNETILEPSSISRPDDQPLRPDSAGILHLSRNDINNANVSNRIQRLMPANINPNDNSLEANDRRRRFTPLSWDLKQYSFPRMLVPVGAPGVDGVDDNGDGVVDDRGEIGWPGSDDFRAWEFSGDLDGDGKFEFPPSGFNSGSPVRAYAGFHLGSLHPDVADPFNIIAPDPFRPQLRRLLETEFGNTDESKLQFRLNLNMLLDIVRPAGPPPTPPLYSPFFDTAGDWKGELEYRPLTDHANSTALTTITTILAPWTTPVPSYPPTNAADREFWARYDRQRMARDIYVMLYVLCGGADSFDYRTNTGGLVGGAAYSAAQKRQMAQFAVNMVDSLDRDNVVSMFEYDTDLSDGWGLDDQPWGNRLIPAVADPDATAGERGVVYGVESQELAFSEILWIYQAKYTGMAAANGATRYDETTQDHHHLFMELRSVASRNVPLFGATRDYDPLVDPLPSTISTTHASAAWRIRRRDTDDASTINQATFDNTITAPENAVYFKADSANNIAPGTAFTIATADNDSGDNMSDFYVKYNPMSTSKLIAPYDPVVSPPATGLPQPQCKIDLISNDPSMTSRFGVEHNMPSDSFLNATTAPTGSASTRFTLVLERRLDPTQVQLPVTINPWITVDVVQPRRRSFNLQTTDTLQAAIEAKLQNLTSRERREPLDSTEANGTGDGTRRMNSLKADSPSSSSYDGTNDTGNDPFNIVQTHFDRDLASSIELMTISLYGPGYQTRTLGRADLSAYDQSRDLGAAIDEGTIYCRWHVPDAKSAKPKCWR